MSFLQQTSLATILSSTLVDLFPDAILMNSFSTEKGFFCDFSVPFLFERKFLPLLEERMNFCVKKKLNFVEMEMVPANAAEFLRHRGSNSFIINKVLAKSGLVSLVQLSHFVSLSSGAHLPTTADVMPFKLVSAFQYDGWIRLFGIVGDSKEELKQWVKTKRSDESHLALAEKLQLFKPYRMSSGKKNWIGWSSLPLGEHLKKNILKFVERHFSDIDLITTHGLDLESLTLFHLEYIKNSRRRSWEVLKMPLSGDGLELLNPAVGFCDNIFFTSNEDSTISFLQNIVSFLKIFNFDFKVFAVGRISKLLKNSLCEAGVEIFSREGRAPCIEFEIADCLGRYWTGPMVWHEERRKIIRSSLFYSLERFIALLLENKSSKLLYELMEKSAL